ncbi:exodeoxyribonuclease VII small subunit [Thiohalorhabdus sp.]|uniref:exodeoxyribonuclease VII small subunit n=1 Tax=Thiohalorhabdus sp. TaxID=3094134 RepID=UPI002FC29D4D
MTDDSQKPPESADQADLSFEQAMAELESLVERLESGEQGLEQDLADFQRGITLARQCETQLKDAEQVVYKLVGEAGEERLEPFAGDDSNDE